MNKTTLIEAAAKKAGLTKKDTALALDAITETILEAMESGDKVAIMGFGSFEIKHRAARTGHNPHTGEAVEIPAATVPVFRPGTVMKQAVTSPEA